MCSTLVQIYKIILWYGLILCLWHRSSVPLKGNLLSVSTSNFMAQFVFHIILLETRLFGASLKAACKTKKGQRTIYYPPLSAVGLVNSSWVAELEKEKSCSIQIQAVSNIMFIITVPFAVVDTFIITVPFAVLL